MSHPKSLNIQCYIDVRIIASLVQELVGSGKLMTNRMSDFLRFITELAYCNIVTEDKQIKDVEYAVEVLQRYGFSMAQLGSKHGGPLRNHIKHQVQDHIPGYQDQSIHKKQMGGAFGGLSEDEVIRSLARETGKSYEECVRAFREQTGRDPSTTADTNLSMDKRTTHDQHQGAVASALPTNMEVIK